MAAPVARDGLRRQCLRQAKKEVEGDVSEGGQGVAAAVGEVLSPFLAAGVEIEYKDGGLGRNLDVSRVQTWRWFANSDIMKSDKLKKVHDYFLQFYKPYRKFAPGWYREVETRLNAVFGFKRGFVCYDCFFDPKGAESRTPVILFPLIDRMNSPSSDTQPTTTTTSTTTTNLTVDVENSIPLDRDIYEMIKSDFHDSETREELEALKSFVDVIEKSKEHERRDKRLWEEARLVRELLKKPLVAAGYPPPPPPPGLRQKTPPKPSSPPDPSFCDGLKEALLAALHDFDAGLAALSLSE